MEHVLSGKTLNPPQIFVSYTRESPEHTARVLKLANRLRVDGLNVVLDQFFDSPPEGWPRWLERQIDLAEFVLLVCTETYLQRIEAPEPRGQVHGVLWESHTINQQIYNVGTQNPKFIPVLLESSQVEHIPSPLRGFRYYRPETKDGYEELFRRLTHQPRITKPDPGPIGKPPPSGTPRRERVNITFSPNVSEGAKEIPFKLLLIAQLAGEPDSRRNEAESFEDIFSKIAPKLKIIPEEGSSPVDLELKFESLEDFSPQSLADRIPALAQLMAMRSRLRELKTHLAKGDMTNAAAIVKLMEASLAGPSEAVPSDKAATTPGEDFNIVRVDRPGRSQQARGKRPYIVKKIFFATDRRPADRANRDLRFFDNERSPKRTLSMGVCEVSIPETHKVGALESPTIWKLEFRRNPKKHVVLLNLRCQQRTTFFRDIAEAVGTSEHKHAFVFIHGYNTTFETAARRTAQLAHDLQFDGAPILFSWPSKGRAKSYVADETNVAWTAPQLKSFLEELASRVGASTIHLIAHSMGNRALAAALETITTGRDLVAPLFRQIVLTAPDIDADTFRNLATAISRTGDRVTVYSCGKDKALLLSRRFHEYPRAGASIVIAPGIDTIDASAVDTSLVGHSYFGSSRSVLSDIFALFRSGEPPLRRFGMTEKRIEDGIYYLFRP